MLAAIEGAQKQILFETYIWKGDEVGERFKPALAEAADRGVEVYCIYDGFANLVVSPAVQAVPAADEGAALPRLHGGLAVLRPAPLRPRPPQDPRRRRRGRLRRAATTSGRRTPPSGATPTCRITGPGVWDLKRAFADFWNLNRRKRFGPQRAAAADGDRVDLGAPDPAAPQRAAAVDVPDPVDVHRGDQPGQPQRLDDPRLLHPRPGLRRRAQGRRAARGRRTPAAAR